MAKENLQQLRQLIAQQAARMMAEDGVSDFAYAKKKAVKIHFCSATVKFNLYKSSIKKLPAFWYK